MRPEARIAAAIEILEDIFAGEAAERCLTTWGRTHRFAGSGDRAAIRDHVFDALRCKRSFGWLGGSQTGRGLMIGALQAAGHTLDTVFTGDRHAPPPLAADEVAAQRALDDAPLPVQLDCPDWLWPVISDTYGAEAAALLHCMQQRAPVFLRVNLLKGSRSEAAAVLAEDEIRAEPHALCETALRVTENARRVKTARAFREGYVELQDAASQAVVEACMPYVGAGPVLDYCAGGGGKALALAAAGAANVTAHDVSAARMKDIPARAARAGTPIRVVEKVRGHFDLVLCDAPCSGSGAWRRQPDAKWRLDADALTALMQTQDGILDKACEHVAPGGSLAYATCSLLPHENAGRAAAFLERHAGWQMVLERQWTPLDGADGFFLAVFQRS